MVDQRIDRSFGPAAFEDHARERLGISIRKAWALLKIEKATVRSADFDRAYPNGSPSWVRALSLLPVLERAPAPAWIARAESVTVRRLRDEVEWVLASRDALGVSVSLAPPPLDSRLSSPFVVTPPDAVAVPWTALERLLRHVITHWESAPRHPDPVFARDGWRCTVPACSSRRNLHDHHIRFRSRGGDNRRDNRTTVCAAHHLHGLHAGTVGASGIAPHAIEWQLGVRPGAVPFLTYVGDRLCRPGDTSNAAASPLAQASPAASDVDLARDAG